MLKCLVGDDRCIRDRYVNGTHRTWIHYVELRSGHGTQKDTIELARHKGGAIHAIFPMIEDFTN